MSLGDAILFVNTIRKEERERRRGRERGKRRGQKFGSNCSFCLKMPLRPSN